MTHEEHKLEPCPFCGGAPAIVTRNVEPQGDPWYGRKDETFVLCDCGACLFDGDFHEGFYDAETRAIAAWNRRAHLQHLPLTGREATRAALEELVSSHFSVIEHPDPEEEARRSHQRMAAAWKQALIALGKLPAPSTDKEGGGEGGADGVGEVGRG